MRPLILAAALVAAPTAAQVRAVPEQPASASAAKGGVDVFLFNEGVGAAPAMPPERIEVTAADGSRVMLVPAGAAPATIAAGGFARLRYRASTPATAAAPSPSETVVETSNGVAFGPLDRFTPHEPIYGVTGLGDSGAKLQFSFAYRPFDEGVLRHFRFAYTQTMFWEIDVPSGPFRSTNYRPEVFADLAVDASTRIAFGYLHDSNGRGEPRSIDVNRIFLRGSKSVALGDGWRAEVVPQAWFYVGKQGIAPDLERYWGYTSLKASVFQPEGIKLSVTARGNPRTGKGAAELYASYPLAPPLGVGVYLFGQGFTGYGEALDDFRVPDTHLRLGIALTR
jgi:hypothetical protein